jgi:hypothetical protein
MFCKNIIKTLHVSVITVWSSSGVSFLLSALPLLRLFASSSCLFGMWLYVVCNVMFALEKKCKHYTADNIQPHTE